MESSVIRDLFLDFFKEKNHLIVPSAPLVIKNDPTLMFVNAGMNQFKDIFLDNVPIKEPRIANTQKCLRVSGKHNDLEEVGHDSYHHTLFEMLGNWSFGDYFKKEAINWAWEFLTEKCKIDKDRIYITIFEGDKSENLDRDTEAFDEWAKLINKDRIINGNKKDNFWEMGDTGPCGPCSEIHVDIRDDKDRKLIDGATLVNKDNPLVIEVWNLVFIQYNRLKDGSLATLPNKHVDTGMGFERLCMVLQNKKSNYDTDVFKTIINEICKISNVKYGINEKQDIAIRVISDHIRPVTFAICDGQLPSNVKAGYIIRRILRRAIRYGYTFLGFNEPFMYKLIPVLVSKMGDYFPELVKYQELATKVVFEEETTFLKTLDSGIQKFDIYLRNNKTKSVIDGVFAFELYDTYGFPIDLTQLLAKENNWTVDMKVFEEKLEEQKQRSKNASVVDAEDWVIVSDTNESVFIGYDYDEYKSSILKYRNISDKKKNYCQIVFDKTPFYPEGGGQVGDKGLLISENEEIVIFDTKKENNLIVHYSEKIPTDTKNIILKVNKKNRNYISSNHTATHLLHNALRAILGTHVEQKGSLVNEENLRFDFSHYQKLSNEEIKQIENLINLKIREGLIVNEHRAIKIEEAQKMGAIALFGEKYGNEVRVISVGDNYSVEFCGGIHVKNISQIGLIKIISESSVAAGIRRIEAVTNNNAYEYINSKLDELENIQLVLNTKNTLKTIENLIEENNQLNKEIKVLNNERSINVKNSLVSEIKEINGIKFIGKIIDLSAEISKKIAFDLKTEYNNLFMIIGSVQNDKALLTLMITDDLVESKNLDASKLIRELSKEIQGGGGGQKFFATAGGNKPENLQKVIDLSVKIISEL